MATRACPPHQGHRREDKSSGNSTQTPQGSRGIEPPLRFLSYLLVRVLFSYRNFKGSKFWDNAVAHEWVKKQKWFQYKHTCTGQAWPLEKGDSG